jgi:pilus assembly protein Flp/PilA
MITGGRPWPNFMEFEMYNALLKTFIRFRHNDEGVTLVEYGVAVALAVAVGIGALTVLGTNVSDAMGAAGARMPNP